MTVNLKLSRIGRRQDGTYQILPYDREFNPDIVITAVPTISGTVAPGNTVTAVTGTYTPSGTIHVGYQWVQTSANAVVAQGTANTFAIAANSPSGTLTLYQTVVFNGRTKTAQSAASTITASSNAPVFISAPVISSNSTVVGVVLTCTDGVASGTPTPTISRQWYRGATAISGATNSTYTTVTADIGNSITVKNTAVNGVNPAATSNSSNAIVITATAAGFFRTVSTLAALKQAMIDAPGGSIIGVNAGTYTGQMNFTTALNKSPNIVIRPTNRASPPVFKADTTSRATPFYFAAKAEGITFDQLYFDFDGPDNRTDYTPFGIVFKLGFNNIKIIGCWFKNLAGIIEFQGGGSNVEVAYCTSELHRIDDFRLYNIAANLWVHHNKVFNTNANTTWQFDTNRHQDGFQMACTNTVPACNGAIFEDNYIRNTQNPTNLHGVFAFSENIYKNGKPFDDWCHQNLKVRRNYFEGCGVQCITIGGVKNAEIKNNLIKLIPGTTNTTSDKTPCIYFLKGTNAPSVGKYYYENIDVDNNAIPKTSSGAYTWGNGPTTGNISGTSRPVNVTITNTVDSSVGAVPTGWSGYAASNVANVGHTAYVPAS